MGWDIGQSIGSAVRFTLGTKRPKLGTVANPSPRETEKLYTVEGGTIVGPDVPKPCADKQRIMGRTALPVPATTWSLWSDAVDAARRRRSTLPIAAMCCLHRNRRLEKRLLVWLRNG
jgi:hypothetical protein